MNYIFVISLRTTEHNLTNLTLRMFTIRYYTSVVTSVQIDRDFHPPHHYLSPSFLPILLNTSLSPSSSSLLLSLPALLLGGRGSEEEKGERKWMERNEGGEVVRRRI
jgi:hypothetical protein